MKWANTFLHLCCSVGHCVEPGDPPLLQQPLHTSKSGIQQIIECFRSGTSQLKNMLLKEVDTIFECKLCRSLFRGLPNLITHKEYYCLSRLPEPDDGDKQTIAMKDLMEAIYPRADRPDFVVRLEPIQTTNKAMFQYLSTEEEMSPVAWEGQSTENVDNNQPSQPVETESQKSPSPPPVEEEKPPEETPVPPQAEDEDSNSGDVTISCCLCGQDFNSRRSIRRHCRKMHKTKLEELRKFTETRTVPTSLLSMVKGTDNCTLTVYVLSFSCPVCLKSFATKANVRRHFDEVHRGLRRDNIAPNMATKPDQPFVLDDTAPRRSNTSSSSSSSSSSSLMPCRCSLCKRTYSSQLMLKRHMRIVHKIYSSKNRTNVSSEEEEEEEEVDIDSSPAPSPSGSTETSKNTEKNTTKAKEDESPPSQKTTTLSIPPLSKNKALSVGFDFKQLFCKLCKRQFSSRQNLSKHIELHTDGTEIFIKFYRCPLCSYESRRKRDVLRHVTVVHKKSSSYIAKIMPKLESRAVKRQAEAVLTSNNTPNKRATIKEEVNGRHCTSPSPLSPSSYESSSPGSTEVRVTKNFSLHACDQCGRAFAKKFFLESHKRSHRNPASPEPGRRRGVSTRSRALVW
uniref:C2H2-type domain-containing protein n=1 Tax=Periophthalmus magnuspinnatus TaxID=409849 RepID=A0A3B3ZJT0_9GOBI